MRDHVLFHREIAGDPAGGAPPVEAEPAVEEIPAWAQSLNERFDALEQRFQPEPQQPEPQQYDMPVVDPFAENYTEQLYSLVGQAVQQAMGPYTDWQQSQQLNEAEERAIDIIDDDVSRNGEFMLGEQAYADVRARANLYLNEEAQKHGFGPQAAEAAIFRACADQRAIEQKLAEMAVERHMNQLGRLDGAAREPVQAAAGSSSGYRTPPGGDEMSVLQHLGGYMPGSTIPQRS